MQTNGIKFEVFEDVDQGGERISSTELETSCQKEILSKLSECWGINTE